MTGDMKFTELLGFKFDTVNGCVNYEGTQMLSHYHEAAYDAHMTGVVFAYLLEQKCDGEITGEYAKQWVNKMMFDAFGSQRLYLLDKPNEEQKFDDVVYLTFEKGFAETLSAETVSHLFSELGDFFWHKDTYDSFFVEVNHLDPSQFKDKSLESFIAKCVESVKECVSGCLYQDAPKFVAHQRNDYT